jgi:starch synthase
MSQVLPIYLKKIKEYKEDPIFANTKLVLSLYDEISDVTFSDKMGEKILLPGIKSKDIATLNPANGINLAKLAIDYADGIILGSENISKEVEDYAKASNLPVLPYVEISSSDNAYIKEYNQFYDKILEGNAI